MGIAIPQVVTEDRASGALVVDGSLKFIRSDSNVLKRTPSTIGNRRAFTWSGWVKRSNPSVQMGLFSTYAGSHPSTALILLADGSLRVQDFASSSYNIQLDSNARLRDPNAFFHIVVSFDTTQATTSNRVRVYINGEQLTSFSTANYGSQNLQTDWNNTTEHNIGRHDQYLDGCLSNVYCIDGQALDASHFGYTDPLTNTWRPKKYVRGVFEELDKFNTYTWGEAQNQLDYQGIKFPTAAGGTVAWKATGSSNTGLNLYTSTDSNNWTRRLTNQTVDSTNGLVYESTYQYVILVNGVDATWANQLQMFSDVNGAQIHYSNADWPGNGNPTMTWARGSYTDGTIASYNSFYLPMDGNSPIGEDKSGIGNNWTPDNFGGSNSLDKATGAKPILNTLPGGTIATPGVFGSKASAQYATTSASNSGGKYYFSHDAAAQPTFSFIRGATYTFDYSASSSHPLRFATAADAAGSTEYTNGTSISGNVIKFTVPHNAPNTLYYYCNVHNGMGNSISVTTDETKADPYAWKCTLAIPFINDTSDHSGEINCTVSSKATGSDNLTFSTPGDMFYGSPAKLLGNGSSNSRVTIASGAFGFGTGDFTIEFWGHFTATGDQGNRNARILTAQSESGEFVQILSATSTAKMQFDNNHIPNTEILNKTRHYVYQRTGTTCQLIVDGVLYDSDAQSRNFADVAYQIGRYDASNGGASLYMVDFRVYTGVQKYPNSGLSIGDQVFIPASISPDILPDTPSGVSGSSKLTKITDGAVAFDGASDNLSVPDHADLDFGTDTFTIECFLYMNSYGSSGSYPSFVSKYTNSLSWILRARNTGKLIWYSSTGGGTNNESSANPMTLKKWLHIAAVREGTGSNQMKVYVDGKLHLTVTDANDYDDSNVLCIGSQNTGNTNVIDGFVSNVRIVKGTAVYTSEFTPPFRTLTNVTNTKLLCCQSPTSATTATVIPTGSITANGNAVASTFSPFNTDINTVRGQETGYCTFNPLIRRWSVSADASTLSNGNFRCVFDNDNQTGYAFGSMLFPSTGKFYFETHYVSGDAPELNIGVGPHDNQSNVYSYIMYKKDGNKRERYAPGGDTSSSYGETYAPGDTIGCAVDVNGDIEFFKNGISQGVAFSSISIGGTWGPFFFGDSYNGTSPTIDLNTGQKPFKFPPPAGFQSLNAVNAKPVKVFARPDQYVGVTTYLGTGAAQKIPGLNFQSDLIWVKARDATYNHRLWDSVKGFGSGKALYPDETSAMGTNSSNDGVISTDIDGWTFTTTGARVNNAKNYVGWSWKAGGSKNTFNVDDVGYASAAAAGLTGGSLTITGASVGTKQGFSIIKYTGNATTPETISHGLLKAPQFIIGKNTGQDIAWSVYTTTVTAANSLQLNSNTAPTGGTGIWGNTEPTSSVFTVGNDGNMNGDGQTMIAYCWHDVPGLQKFGTYEGSGNADTGPFVELGFKPALLMVKNIDDTENWYIYDPKRSPSNVAYQSLQASSSGVEETSSSNTRLDLLSNGFKLRQGNGPNNANTYIYAAWAEAPAFNMYGAQSNAR